MNRHAAEPDAFDSKAIGRARAFAEEASRAMLLPVRLTDSIKLASQFQAALVSRPTIDPAIGIIMA